MNRAMVVGVIKEGNKVDGYVFYNYQAEGLQAMKKELLANLVKQGAMYIENCGMKRGEFTIIQGDESKYPTAEMKEAYRYITVLGKEERRKGLDEKEVYYVIAKINGVINKVKGEELLKMKETGYTFTNVVVTTGGVIRSKKGEIPLLKKLEKVEKMKFKSDGKEWGVVMKETEKGKVVEILVEDGGKLRRIGATYYADTLLEAEGGLRLHGDVPEWTVSVGGMAQIKAWIKGL